MSFSEQHRQAVIREALQRAAHLGLLSFGAGAAIRGGGGLWNLGRRNLAPIKPPQLSAMELDVPIRDERRKQASMGESVWNTITKPVSDAVQGNVSKSQYWPFSVPMSMLAVGGGLYGGHKVVDTIMDRRRRDEIENSLAKARREYEEALSGKSALSQDLDRLYEGLEKRAVKGMSDITGAMMALYLSLGIPIAAATAMASYDMTRKRQPAQLLQKAKERRMQDISRRQPLPTHARPVYADDFEFSNASGSQGLGKLGQDEAVVRRLEQRGWKKRGSGWSKGTIRSPAPPAPPKPPTVPLPAPTPKPR